MIVGADYSKVSIIRPGRSRLLEFEKKDSTGCLIEMETIQGRTLFKGGNYMRKYSRYLGPSLKMSPIWARHFLFNFRCLLLVLVSYIPGLSTH